METTSENEKGAILTGADNAEGSTKTLNDQVAALLSSESGSDKSALGDVVKVSPKVVRRRSSKRKKKRTRTRSAAPKKDALKVEPVGGSSVSNDTVDTRSEYQKSKDKYLADLDADAKSDLGPDAVHVDGDPIPDVNGPGVEPKKKNLGGSLVVLTNFVLPILCNLAIRVASRGKKKVDTKRFRLDEFEIEMLNELSDAAADEILGKMNPALTYCLVVFALGVSKTLDAWDAEDKMAQVVVQENMVSMEDFAKMKADFERQIEELKELRERA